MDELDFDSHFLFSFPVWICAAKDNPMHVMGGKLQSGQPYAALFSSEDLAERFIADRKVIGQAVPSQITNAQGLLIALRLLKQGGFSHVVFDDKSASKFTNFIFEIGAAIVRTEARLNE